MLERILRWLGMPEQQPSISAQQRARREAALAQSEYAWSGKEWDASMAERLKRG
jgi:hypothetical protein